MSSKIIVDTSDETSVPVQIVDVVHEGDKRITIDTVKDDMDEIVRQAPPTPPPTPEPINTPAPAPKAASPKPKPKPTAPSAKKMLDGQAAFQDALRETIPVAAASTSADVDASPQQEAEPEPEPEPEAVEEEEVAEVEEEEPAPPAPEEDDGEDEDVKKLRIIEEIHALMGDGFLPPQEPSLNMDIKTLTKIKDYQEAAATEAFGVQLIGRGWIGIIGLVENLNEQFDPAAKVFGPGRSLKLRGATEKVAENIKLYRKSFRYLWKKIGSKKLEEYNPLITMAFVTMDIFMNVHTTNVRREMREAAEAELNRPEAYQDAMRLAGSLPPRDVPTPRAPPVPATYAQRPPTPPPPQPALRPVDDIEIPESDGEEEQEAPAPTPAPVDDDEIEVEVPKEKSRKGRKGGKKTKN